MSIVGRSSASASASGSAGAGVGTSGIAAPPPKLEHAYLELYEPPAATRSLKVGLPTGRIDFQFNPTEWSTSRESEWTRDPQRANATSGHPQFLGARARSMALEMFLDSSSPPTRDVVTKVDKLFECCVPTQESGEKHKPSPPWVVFRWGEQTGFQAYISKVQVAYTLFTPSGLPIRAVATINMLEIVPERTGTNPTSGGTAARSSHTVVTGETLPVIAWQAYGDPARWRAVAAANDIDDPLRLRPGKSLLLPAESELDGVT